MIDLKNYVISDEGCCILRSANDKKQYKFLKLENGLKVLLIQSSKNKVDNIESLEEEIKHKFKRTRLSKDESSSEDSSNESEEGEKMAAMALSVNVGSFHDPEDLQGLAHYVEHVVLMGNEQYPEVNEFDNFISEHCGSSNACTEKEYTTYEAEIPNHYLEGCLKRFSACFKKPLFKQEYIESEIFPVNNEFIDNFIDDNIRYDHFLANFAKKNHPLSYFSWGNFKSLVELPKSKNINVQNVMVEFFEKYYKADKMALVIQSQEKLSYMEQLVKEMFKDLPVRTVSEIASKLIDRSEILKTLESCSQVSFYEKEAFNNIYCINPIEDGHYLRIVYVFPSLINFYKTKPLVFLSTILGFEGEKSLISFLLKKKLILEFVVGQSECNTLSNEYQDLFCFDIKLTDYGLENVDLVIKYIDYYIDLMDKKGVEKELFYEESLIELNKTRFEDEISELKNVVELSKYLFVYPLEDTIVGSKISYEYDPESIKLCLKYLKSKNRIFTIQSKKYFKTLQNPIHVDEWSDIQYKFFQAPDDWFQPIEVTDDLKKNLNILGRNDFIATDFNLKKELSQNMNQNLLIIDESTFYKCFFKNDQTFMTPKSCINLFWSSSFLRDNPIGLVSLKFYINYFMLIITEQAYPAVMASLRYSLDIKNSGLELKLNGFNHKLFKLLKVLLDKLFEFDIDENLFDTVKTDSIRSYYNLLIDSDCLIEDLILSCTFKNYISLTVLREQVKTLTIENIKQNIIQFFKTSFLQCLIQGNYTKDEAKEIFSFIKEKNIIKQEEVNFNEISKFEILDLPVGQHYCYVKSFNESDENILINNFYQLGQLDLKHIVILDLVMQEMSEPLFNLLRNQQTLAYQLYCRYYKVSNICAYSIVVKSLADKYDPIYVDEKIESFIEQFLNESIINMKLESFNELLSAKIKKKKIPDICLKHEVSKNWSKIISYQYDFNRKTEEIKILKNLSFEEFKSWSIKILTKNSTRKKLSVCSIGNGEKTDKCMTLVNNSNEKDKDLEEMNDLVNYQKVFMVPKVLKDDCNMIVDLKKFNESRTTF